MSTAERTAKRGVELRLSEPTGSPIHEGRGFVAAWDWVINPYVNCEFGCGYCYAQNLRPEEEGDDQWGKWVQAKMNAGHQVERMLYDPSRGDSAALDGQTIFISTSTDPYQPVEKELRVTRHVLEALAGEPRNHAAPMFGPPTPRIAIQTRSPLAGRDVDLFDRINRNGGAAQVNMTVSTDADDVRRVVEPRCMDTKGRLNAVAKMSAAGIPTCITVTPFLAVDNHREFAKTLTGSGARRFVTQKLHPTDRPTFTAASRPGSDEMVRRIHEERGTRYNDEYRRFRDTLIDEVERAGLMWMGEERNGFRPPWGPHGHGTQQSEDGCPHPKK